MTASRTLNALVPIVLLAGVIGCGRATDSAVKDENKPLVIGFIYIGARDDYGYNQAHAQGAAAVKKLPGVVVKEEETVPDTMDVQKSMKGMIELNHASIIFPTSFGYYDPHVLRLAARYPDVKFIHCGGLYDEKEHPANVGTYFGFIDECQYLSGIVAAHATKTKKLGFVAGKAIPQVRRNINAFTMVLHAASTPEITCTVIFTGDWSLSVKEAEATLNLIDQGIDVLTCHVNSPKVASNWRSGCRAAYTCGYHADQSRASAADEISDRGRVELGEDLHRLCEHDPRRPMEARPATRRLEGRFRAHVALWPGRDAASPQGRRCRKGEIAGRFLRDLQGPAQG